MDQGPLERSDKTLHFKGAGSLVGAELSQDPAHGAQNRGTEQKRISFASHSSKYERKDVVVVCYQR